MGEHDHGLYAMPSFVDEKALTIRTWPLLLEGPEQQQQHRQQEGTTQQADTGDLLDIPLPKDTGRQSSLVFGYYDVPEKLTVSFSPSVTQLQLTDNSNSHQQVNTIPALLPPQVVDYRLYSRSGFLS